MNISIKIVDSQRVIVTAISEEDPLRKLKVIANELIEKKFRGYVIFDLLIFNGNEINRFVLMNFDGVKFDKNNVSHSAHIDPKLEMNQNAYFIENKILLQNSVLSSFELANFS
ncbi:type II toxin-antitoxin system RnlB family antitoxin [Acinetobacter courvalinii]|uniref:type II toxin-antitoxin system RnlB family antitoxin n=1 Tax=Acinetobacter courvalinii TaxID=280147 RepID=UPI0021CE2D91|nr:type II toxin-antitoxin system RnlB family antitoxin [Acinetobacter courvalinii]MCU4576141.1 type II toxin-antitoxin system RnlB family antitoxin [Acinetobacter courvalinii]